MTFVSPQKQLFCEFYDKNAFGLLKEDSYIRKYKIASIVSWVLTLICCIVCQCLYVDNIFHVYMFICISRQTPNVLVPMSIKKSPKLARKNQQFSSQAWIDQYKFLKCVIIIWSPRYAQKKIKYLSPHILPLSLSLSLFPTLSL